MKILVLNGSPKGKYSITLQTVRYWEALYPEHSFQVLHVGQTIKSLEKDFTPARQAIENAEVLLFSYPVYTFIAPSQLHRFVELLKQENMDLSHKYASQLTTSKHFYDVTAHRYIEDNCYDLGLKYIRGLSADMDDLLEKKGQKEAQDFFAFLRWSVENDQYEAAPQKQPAFVPVPVTVPENKEEKTGDVVIVTDCEPENTQISNMIARFQAVFPRKTRIVNIREYPFRLPFPL